LTSLIFGWDADYFNFQIHLFSTNLAKFKAAVAAGTGGDMLDSSAEFSEGLTVRPTTSGWDHLFSSFTAAFRNLTVVRDSLDWVVL